ncbi:MAG: TlpA family protein disulfide reductase [Deferribacteraceae bacterium]|jgi:thiol-disulfide isomerase/thioredoxin|nr:TlpA family protein disulfide reductase [Deferribacteraceae bacterium]
MSKNIIRNGAVILLLILCFVGCRGKRTPKEIIVSDIETLETQEYGNLRKDNQGKVLIVNVFATWCPPCETETPDFVKVYNELGGGSFELIALSIDKRKSDIISFVNFYGIRYPVYQIKSDLQHRLRADKIPTTLIYLPDGSFYTSVLGAVSEEYLTNIINKLKEKQ